jgi:glycerol-1-phosphatase
VTDAPEGPADDAGESHPADDAAEPDRGGARAAEPDRSAGSGADVHEPPAHRYDVALLDLDGVVYLGSTAIPDVPEALAEVRKSGMRLAFVTNNASRTPAAVAEMLTGMGVQATADEVVSSAQAACHVLAEKLPAGAKVLVVGTTGLIEAARERGFTVVGSADDDPAAVVQGYGPNVGWQQLAEATVAVRRGAWFVATNLDATVPSNRGPLPGNGALVGVVAQTTGVTPTAVGKPDPAMHRESVQRSGATHPIVVGDRLDTDIEGAGRVGCDSMLVLTGVTTPADLLGAGPRQRPTYVAASVRGLLDPQPVPRREGDGWVCGGWRATADLALSGDGDDLDALRALSAAAWAAGGVDRRAAAAAVKGLRL